MMEPSFLKMLFDKNTKCADCPSPSEIISFADGVISLLFPAFDKKSFDTFEDFESHVEQLKAELHVLLARNLDHPEEASEKVDRFFEEMPHIHELLQEDVQAMFEGDPAAKSTTEIIRSYPGFYAVAAYRIAHCLSDLQVELIPRIISELAHGKTGIDIHPRAEIGRHFCIDHGTGIVIGETTHIGHHVKIYQGVTLGGLSVAKSDAEKKRHPTIEDHVVLYAGATILGGHTVIGHHSIVGGNVWLTRSVPPNTKVYYKAALTNNDGQTDIIEFKS
jgi:serine O-acetyltransferase